MCSFGDDRQFFRGDKNGQPGKRGTVALLFFPDFVARRRLSYGQQLPGWKKPRQPLSPSRNKGWNRRGGKERRECGGGKRRKHQNEQLFLVYRGIDVVGERMRYGDLGEEEERERGRNLQGTPKGKKVIKFPYTQKARIRWLIAACVRLGDSLFSLSSLSHVFFLFTLFLWFFFFSRLFIELATLFFGSFIV